MKKLKHGQLLDAKLIMNGPMGMFLDVLEDLIPKALQGNLRKFIKDFEDELAHCDVSDRYEEIK